MDIKWYLIVVLLCTSLLLNLRLNFKPEFILKYLLAIWFFSTVNWLFIGFVHSSMGFYRFLICKNV